MPTQSKRFWYVTATVNVIKRAGTVTKQCPMFILDNAVQGIVYKAHAERIADDLLRTATDDACAAVTTHIYAVDYDAPLAAEPTLAALIALETQFRMAATDAAGNGATTVSGKIYAKGYATAFDDAAMMLTTLRLEMQDRTKADAK
jgi:hypothetical protein